MRRPSISPFCGSANTEMVDCRGASAGPVLTFRLPELLALPALPAGLEVG